MKGLLGDHHRVTKIAAKHGTLEAIAFGRALGYSVAAAAAQKVPLWLAK